MHEGPGDKCLKTLYFRVFPLTFLQPKAASRLRRPLTGLRMKETCNLPSHWKFGTPQTYWTKCLCGKHVLKEISINETSVMRN